MQKLRTSLRGKQDAKTDVMSMSWEWKIISKINKSEKLSAIQCYLPPEQINFGALVDTYLYALRCTRCGLSGCGASSQSSTTC